MPFFKLLSLISFILLQATPAFSEGRVLILMSTRIKPYVDVLEGFKNSIRCKTTELVLSEIDSFDAKSKVRALNPSMVLTIGMGALDSVKDTIDLPIVYTMVLNPHQLIGDKKNITGVSLNIPPQKFLTVIKEVVPDLNRVGLVFDPRKSMTLVEKTWFSAKAMGVNLTARKVYVSKDVPEVLRKMAEKIDVYLMLQDLTVTSPAAVKFLVDLSFKKNIPVFSFSKKYTALGALASLQTDDFDMGKQAAELAGKILAGMDPKDIPKSHPRDFILTINLNTAKKMGIKISDAVIKKARVIK